MSVLYAGGCVSCWTPGGDVGFGGNVAGGDVAGASVAGGAVTGAAVSGLGASVW